MDENDIQFKTRAEVKKIMEEKLLVNPNPTKIDIAAGVRYAPNINISTVAIPGTLDEADVLAGLQALMEKADLLSIPEIRELSVADVERMYLADLSRLAYLYSKQLPSDELYLKIANQNDDGYLSEGYDAIVETESAHVAEFLNLDALYRQYGICVQSALAVAQIIKEKEKASSGSNPAGKTNG